MVGYLQRIDVSWSLQSHRRTAWSVAMGGWVGGCIGRCGHRRTGSAGGPRRWRKNPTRSSYRLRKHENEDVV